MIGECMQDRATKQSTGEVNAETKRKNRCILILSSKSSGSSALQRLLAQFPQVHSVGKTRHKENESLYWVKAASILEMPQEDLSDSEVPIPKEIARKDLVTLIRENADHEYQPPSDPKTLVYEGWHKLCDAYQPVFLEKSPHHLHQWSAIELILECMQRQSDTDFLVVGLVRNPMDCLYSMWKRWQGDPNRGQQEWYTAYKNLQRLQQKIPDKLVLLRYEDVVNDNRILEPVYRFIQVSIPKNNGNFHRKSLAKWKSDKFFGFKLRPEVMELAQEFGYTREELVGATSGIWNYYYLPYRWINLSIIAPVRKALRKLKRMMLKR